MILYDIKNPGGSDTHIQYNKGGIFGGNAAAVFNDGTGVSTFTGATVTNCAVLGSNSAVFQPNADSTTFLQLKDQAGNVDFNYDSTEGRFAIGAAASARKLIVEDTGNTPFEVSGTAADYTRIAIDAHGGVNANSQISFQFEGSSKWSMGLDNSDSGKFKIASSSSLTDSTRITITSVGYMGIRISPSIPFHVRGTAVPNFDMDNFSTLIVEDTDGRMEFVAADTGNNAAALILTDAVGAGDNRKWFIGAGTTSSDNKLFIGYSTNLADVNPASSSMFVMLKTGELGLGEPDPETPIELTHAQPYITLHNSTHEDSDGGRESKLIFKGEKADETEHTLAIIEVGHDGTGNDYDAYWKLSLNGTTDGVDTVVDVIKVDSDFITHIGDGTNETQIAANGLQTMIGTARVQRHIHFSGAALGKGATAPSERTTEEPYVSYTYGINDDSSLSVQIPDNMDFTVDAYIKIHWYTDIDQTGTEVRFDVLWNARKPGETINAGSTTQAGVNINCPAQYVILDSLLETIPANSLEHGDIFGLDIERVAIGDGSNPAVDSIHIVDVEVEYTSNKLGEAT